jgi:hypothetical protein
MLALPKLNIELLDVHYQDASSMRVYALTAAALL